MNFNSFEFLIFFFPLFLIFYFLFYKKKIIKNANFLIIIIFSCFFYIFFSFKYFLILLSSIIINYFLTTFYSSNRKKFALYLAITLNLLLLIYFKYSVDILNFFQDDFVFSKLILPLGISFFTFQQLSYHFDVYQEKKNRVSFLKYFSFVIFFPQLIAGPIIKIGEFYPKSFKKNKILQNFSIGFTIFIIGLSKKVLIADNLSFYVDPLFESELSSLNATFFEAWFAVISYTFQIYFDFSGYSDMAIGMAKIIGLDFPSNFRSPLKEVSIINFWRSWHITLTRFTTGYIFNPITIYFSKFSYLKKNYFINLFFSILITFFVIGIWHGSGINFIIFGLLHGLFFLINYYYRFLKEKINFIIIDKIIFIKIIYWFLTFVSIVIAFIFFRSSNLNQSLIIIKTLLEFDQIVFPITLSDNFIKFLYLIGFSEIYFGDLRLLKDFYIFPILCLCLLITLLMPNTEEITINFEKIFKSNWKYFLGLISGIFLVISIFSIGNSISFLYYQF